MDGGGEPGVVNNIKQLALCSEKWANEVMNCVIPVGTKKKAWLPAQSSDTIAKF